MRQHIRKWLSSRSVRKRIWQSSVVNIVTTARRNFDKKANYYANMYTLINHSDYHLESPEIDFVRKKFAGENANHSQTVSC